MSWLVAEELFSVRLLSLPPQAAVNRGPRAIDKPRLTASGEGLYSPLRSPVPSRREHSPVGPPNLPEATRPAMPSRRNHRPRKPPPLVQAKRAVIGGIKTVTESPWMKFTTGVVLLTSGLDEAVETLFADLSALELGAHHGVMVLGFVNVLSSLPDMLDGLVGTFLVDEHDDADGTDTPTTTGSTDPATIGTANAPTADTEQLRRAA